MCVSPILDYGLAWQIELGAFIMNIDDPNLINTERNVLTEEDIVRLLSGVDNADKLNLKVVNLPNAKLINADLRRACLIGANLRGTDLSYAQLGKAQLVGANLRGVKSDCLNY
jgi:uncharacterized protein YjbI with pentapeptide repeats